MSFRAEGWSRVPREEEPARALDPTLGLALCATHRAAFDRHLVGVDEGRVFLRAGLEGNGRAKPLWSIQNARMREPRCAVDRDALRQHAGRVRE